MFHRKLVAYICFKRKLRLGIFVWFYVLQFIKLCHYRRGTDAIIGEEQM